MINLFMINSTKYLQRINYQGEQTPSLNLLSQLQKNHLLSIPFENLSIHHNEEIRLDIDRIFQKVVNSRRGGFCYELNGLFHFLLANLGFQVKRISARVFDQEGIPGPEYDHLVNLIWLEEKWWLTDVGFGDFPLRPIPLVPENEVIDRQRSFWVEQTGEQSWMLKKKGTEDKNIDKYIFTTIEREYTEFAAMCHYHQTSDNSPFPKQKLCTIATPNGRITLAGNKFIITEGKQKNEFPIESPEAFDQYLWKYFRMKLRNSSEL
jgi:N-hydroxyarylamine O-acetyltransferase